jgi:5-methylthioadenosine/S-adenosylhomocysteine deaminase
MARLLLQHGCVIDTEPRPTVHRDTDVLVEDGRIAAVGRALEAGGAEVLDASDRIVIPGLVDTHRHGWQSVLRGTAMDLDLPGYLERVARHLAPTMTPADVATAELLTGLECLDAGVTTVLDHAHICFTREHAEAAVSGLLSSGVRARFAYGRPVFGDAWRPADVRLVRERLLPDDDALVTMMLAPLGPSYATPDHAEADWRLARELGLAITVHVGAGPVAQRPIAALREMGVLAAGTVYVHGNSLPDDELALIAGSGGALSITPAVEARMGHGAPTLGRALRLGLTAGLGVDVVTTVPGDLFSVMRAALTSVDASGGQRVSAAEVLWMATIGGATALGMADRIGSLRPGKQADLVLLRADAVATAGTHDPIGTVVNAHPGLVADVLVAGRFVKRDGTLCHPGTADAIRTARAVAERLAG